MPTRRFIALLSAVLLAAVGATVIAPAPATAAPVTRYVFTAFTNTSESNMYVYTSVDGVHYTLLEGSAYTPPGTLVRDPSIIRHNGRYYIVYTTNWQDDKFGIASSTDLVNWQFHSHVPVPISGVTSTWAPEWFVDDDGSVNVIVSISTGNYTDFQPYRFRATDSALTSWASPVALRGLQPNYIDTFIVKSGGTYHAFTKNETTKYIEHAVSNSLDGPYSFVGTGNWSGWGQPLEGQALVRLDNGSWRIYMDAYGAGRYLYADSGDLVNWTSASELPDGLSGFIRHGTVLRDTMDDAGTFLSTGVAQHSGQCLDVPDASTEQGRQLQQHPCNGLGAQSFEFRPAADGGYAIANRENGLCLDVDGQSTANGSAIIQWPCNGAVNQRFNLDAVGGGYRLVAVHSGKCVDVSDASTQSRALLIQWDCHGGANQVWAVNGRP